MGVDAEHDDVVVEVDRSQMKLFADFADLPCGEAKTFFEWGTTVMLTYGVFIAIFIVLYAYAFQIALFKDAILDEVLTVEPANAFEGIIEMLPNTDNAIFLQNEPITFSLVETLLISKKAFLAQINYSWLIAWYFFLLSSGSSSVFHERE